MLKLFILSLSILLSFTVNAHSGHEHVNLSALAIQTLWCLPVLIAIFMLYRMKGKTDWIDNKYNKRNIK